MSSSFFVHVCYGVVWWLVCGCLSFFLTAYHQQIIRFMASMHYHRWIALWGTGKDNSMLKQRNVQGNILDTHTHTQKHSYTNTEILCDKKCRQLCSRNDTIEQQQQQKPVNHQVNMFSFFFVPLVFFVCVGCETSDDKERAAVLSTRRKKKDTPR